MEVKHLLITTIAAVLVVGCTTTQQPEPPTAKAPDITIHEAAYTGNIEAVKQHLAAGTDVNAKDTVGRTTLHYAAMNGHKEIAELLIGKGADVNAKDKEIAELLIGKRANRQNAKYKGGNTPLHYAASFGQKETAALLRKHGGKTGEELKAEGK